MPRNRAQIIFPRAIVQQCSKLQLDVLKSMDFEEKIYFFTRFSFPVASFGSQKIWSLCSFSFMLDYLCTPFLP